MPPVKPRSKIQKYAPEVREATVEIVQQLPPSINSLALQDEIAEAIVARSRAGIINAIQSALAYHSTASSPPVNSNVTNVTIGDININIDQSQVSHYWIDSSTTITDSSTQNYWADNSTTITDSSRQNYWADNRHYEDYSDNSDHSSSELFCFDLSKIWFFVLIAAIVALAFSQPCGQQYQQRLQEQRSEVL